MGYPTSFTVVRGALRPAVTFALIVLANGASAGVWQWGCVGPAGDNQIAFNRDRLAVIAGRAAVGTLDSIARSDDLESAVKPGTIVGDYQADDNNSGLSSPMGFTSANGNSKLTLTEISSEGVGHSEDLIAGCRDETVDRFRKTYRVEADKMQPITVKLMCLEYQLSSRGGRVCE